MFNLDIIIFSAFLFLNLGVGLWYSRGTSTLRQYAVGDKQFPTLLITLTLVATWMSGSSFTYILKFGYTKGSLPIAKMFLGGLSFLILALLAIRTGEFLKHLSIAQSMGSLYGTTARTVVACTGILFNTLIVAMQFKVGGDLVHLLFGWSTFWATILVSGIVIFYATLGGIRAITFTDLVQFVFFSIFVPFLALILWSRLGSSMDSVVEVARSPIFNFPAFIQNPKTIFKLIVGAIIPFSLGGFYSPMFQRLQMTKDVYQAKKSLLYAACIWAIFTGFMTWVVLMLKAHNPNLAEDNILGYVLEQNNFPGFKGIMAVGLMAMVMSTADSYLNTTAVLFANDLAKPLGIKKDAIQIVRITTLLIGIISLFIALSTLYNVKEIRNVVFATYIPIIAPPLVLALFGFRTSKRPVFIGMGAGLITSISWFATPTTLRGLSINNSVPGMVANLIFLLGSHYLLGEPGGWVGIKESEPLDRARKMRTVWWSDFWAKMNLATLHERLLASLPTHQKHYFGIGLYAFLTNYLALYGLKASAFNTSFLQGVVYTLLISTSLIMTYPAWPPFMKKENLTAWAYPLLMTYVFFVAAPIIACLGKFQIYYLLLLVAHITVSIILFPSWILLGMMVLGAVLSMGLLKLAGIPVLLVGTITLQWSIIYVALLFLIVALMLMSSQASKHKLFTENYYSNRLQRQQQQAMLRLKANPARFINRLGYGEYNGLNEVHAFSTKIIKELEEQNVKTSTMKKTNQLVHQIKTNAIYLDQMMHHIAYNMDVDKKPIEIRELLNTLKKRHEAMGTGVKLLTENKSDYTYFHGDFEKSEDILSILINNLAIAKTSPCIFLTTHLTHIHYAKDRGIQKSVAFCLTTHANPPAIKSHYIYADRHATTLSSLTTMVDQYYGCLDKVDAETYVLVLPKDARSINPNIVDEELQELENWVVMDAKIVEGDFWKALSTKEDSHEYKISRINLALKVLKANHSYQPRKSGHLFYTHPMHVAIELMQHTDEEDLIIAALLHDTVEDTSKTIEEIELAFGKRVSTITYLLTNLESGFKKYKLQDDSQKVAKLKASKNRDATLIKLCDRLHNMSTLSAKEPEKRLKKAKETLNNYVPLARELGFDDIADRLEAYCNDFLEKGKEGEVS